MKPEERYVEEVLRRTFATAEEKERLASDLRSHFVEGEATGRSPQDIIAGLGTPDDVATAIGRIEISQEGEDEVKGVSLKPWVPLAGPGLDNTNAIVFNPRGFVANPAEDFGVVDLQGSDSQGDFAVAVVRELALGSGRRRIDDQSADPHRVECDGPPPESAPGEIDLAAVHSHQGFGAWSTDPQSLEHQACRAQTEREVVGVDAPATR